MSNAIAIRCHTQPGDEIITEEKSHIYVYEGGGYAALSGCSVALVSSDLGIMDVSDVESKIRKSAHGKSHYPNGTLVCMENTANRGGGTCYTQEQIDDIAQMAISKDCAVHMDGARLFNAIIASGLEPARVVRDCDTISICISKGLGAPVGGVLVGSKKVIEQAHRWRKMFGGGMRQAGILAAAGLYALDHHIERLAEDHFRARQLAEGLVGTTGIDLNINSVQTNMVYIKTEDLADNIVKLLAAELIDVLAIGTHLIRMVTHLHIDDEGIERTVNAFKKI
jgi:threonine aldolase